MAACISDRVQPVHMHHVQTWWGEASSKGASLRAHPRPPRQSAPRSRPARPGASSGRAGGGQHPRSRRRPSRRRRRSPPGRPRRIPSRRRRRPPRRSGRRRRRRPPCQSGRRRRPLRSHRLCRIQLGRPSQVRQTRRRRRRRPSTALRALAQGSPRPGRWPGCARAWAGRRLWRCPVSLQ